MSDKNRNYHVVIKYFGSEEQANAAAIKLKDWDKAHDAVKLGGMGVVVFKEGKIITHKTGERATKTGLSWGVLLGAILTILSGGALSGGVAIGAVGGALIGSLFHKSIGLSDDDKARLEQHLQKGGAALVVMADDDEVETINAQLDALGGIAESYQVPHETIEKIAAVEDK